MLIFTLNCYRTGSTGRLIRDIEQELDKKNIRFIHFYETGECPKQDNEVRLSGWFLYRIYYLWACLFGWQYGTGDIPAFKVIYAIRKLSPDVVHIHCPNAKSVNLYRIFKYLKSNNIPIVVTNHAEFFYTGNCAHADECDQYLDGCKICPDFKEATGTKYINRTHRAWKRMRMIFRGEFKIAMVGVSPWQTERIKASTLCGHLPIYTIKNGVNTPTVFTSVNCLREKQKIQAGYRALLLHVTANLTDSRKGGKYILELAQCLLEENVRVVIAGGYDELVLDTFNIPDNVVLKGNVNKQELAQLYSMADLTVITSKRETYGMVCAESMCCGTPVVGFNNGGTPSIALKDYCEFVEYGDIECLKQVVLNWIDKKKQLKDELLEKAQGAYSKTKMAEEYLKIYNSVKEQRQ